MPRLVRLSLVIVVATYALIVLGGVTRVTESGMGCHDDWPRCQGQWYPPLETIAIIEYLHRAVASALGLLVLALVVVAFRAPGLRRATRWLPVFAFGLIIVQGLLGAVTVWRELPAIIVTAHLGTSMLFLATTMAIAWLAARDLGAPRSLAGLGDGAGAGDPRLGRYAAVGAAIVFVMILSGGAIATSGAALACDQWPQCLGDQFVPDRTSRYTWLNLTHRTLSALGAVAVIAVWVLARRRAVDPMTRRLAGLAAATVVAQIGFGALYVLADGSRWLGAIHLATATLLWATMLALAAETGAFSRESRRLGGRRAHATRLGQTA
jgi:heme A synthase